MDHVQIQNLSKSYHGRQVLRQVSMCLAPGGVYCLMGPSGIGKTTLLRLLMGLEEPDGGSISGISRGDVSAVFQENRLCEYMNAIKNIRLVSGRDGLAVSPEELLAPLLEREAWHRPVCELSGGMQRRVAVARALAARSGLVLMDEPFTGLDAETKQVLIRTILKYQCRRTLLIVTHQEEDAELLGAEIIRISS